MILNDIEDEEANGIGRDGDMYELYDGGGVGS